MWIKSNGGKDVQREIRKRPGMILEEKPNSRTRWFGYVLHNGGRQHNRFAKVGYNKFRSRWNETKETMYLRVYSIKDLRIVNCRDRSKYSQRTRGNSGSRNQAQKR